MHWYGFWSVCLWSPFCTFFLFSKICILIYMFYEFADFCSGLTFEIFSISFLNTNTPYKFNSCDGIAEIVPCQRKQRTQTILRRMAKATTHIRMKLVYLLNWHNDTCSHCDAEFLPCIISTNSLFISDATVCRHINWKISISRSFWVIFFLPALVIIIIIIIMRSSVMFTFTTGF